MAIGTDRNTAILGEMDPDQDGYGPASYVCFYVISTYTLLNARSSSASVWELAAGVGVSTVLISCNGEHKHVAHRNFIASDTRESGHSSPKIYYLELSIVQQAQLVIVQLDHVGEAVFLQFCMAFPCEHCWLEPDLSRRRRRWSLATPAAKPLRQLALRAG